MHACLLFVEFALHRALNIQALTYCVVYLSDNIYLFPKWFYHHQLSTSAYFL